MFFTFLFAGRLMMSICSLAPVVSQSTQASHRLVGRWHTGNYESVVEIFEEGGLFYGKVVSLAQPLDKEGLPKKDRKNRDHTLRNRPQLGLLVLYRLRYNAGKQCWDSGKVYVPSMGREADAILVLENTNTLKIRGFVGSEKLGQTQVWIRKS